MSNNKSEVRLLDGRIVCCSYGVPVAAMIPLIAVSNLLDAGTITKAEWKIIGNAIEDPKRLPSLGRPAAVWVCTDLRYSVTTTKHMNSWANPANRVEVSDHLLRKLIAPVEKAI